MFFFKFFSLAKTYVLILMGWVLFLFTLRIFYTEDHLAYKCRQPVDFFSCLYAFYFLHFDRGLDPHRIMLNMSGGNEHPHSDGNAIMHRRTKTLGINTITSACWVCVFPRLFLCRYWHYFPGNAIILSWKLQAYTWQFRSRSHTGAFLPFNF